jgi:hypothetical protein
MNDFSQVVPIARMIWVTISIICLVGPRQARDGTLLVWSER